MIAMSDDLARYRAEFPITECCAFLSHSSVSSPSRRVTDAMQQYAERSMREPMLRYGPDMQKLLLDLRQQLARLINARGADEIALMPNTATGINTAALSLPLRAGDNVLVLDGDYPANVYPWWNLAYRGVLTKVVPQHAGGLSLDLLEQRIDRHTRVIALSTAMFATGFRNDIAAVGALCRERGISFVVDAIQTLGAFPIDVQAHHIDVLAAGSQKWLLSTPGGGLLYMRREVLNETQPGAYVGASSVVDMYNFLDYNLTAPTGAERFHVGMPPFAVLAGLHAAVELLHEVGIERISQQILHLVDVLLTDMAERGYQVAASTAPEHRSGIVIVQVPDAGGLCKQFERDGVILTPRGGGVRVSPHFYNTEAEVLRVGELLEAYGVAPGVPDLA
jgi:selenocysteine lyase/cysteine desulfurase